MNLKLLYHILGETTGKIHSDNIPDLPKEDFEIIDCVLVKVVVNKLKARAHKKDLIELLRNFPNEQLIKEGPSYIAMGGELGDQGAAFQLFALGHVLELWRLVTPITIGMTGKDAIDAAGVGWVMITGFNKDHFYGQ